MSLERDYLLGKPQVQDPKRKGSDGQGGGLG